MSLDVLKAFILGVLEGLTEFLPVSSTGHLLLLETFFGFDDDEFGKTFVVLIQLGAILAILSIYFGRLWRIAIGMFSDPAARRFVIGVLIAFLPAAVIGAALHGFIKSRAVQPVGRLLHADRRRRHPAVGRPARSQAALPRRHAVLAADLFRHRAGAVPGDDPRRVALGRDHRVARCCSAPTSARRRSSRSSSPCRPWLGAFAYDLYKNYGQMTADNDAAGRGRLRHLVRRRLVRGQDAARLRDAPRLRAVRLVAGDRRLARPDRAGARLRAGGLTHARKTPPSFTLPLVGRVACRA